MSSTEHFELEAFMKHTEEVSDHSLEPGRRRQASLLGLGATSTW